MEPDFDLSKNKRLIARNRLLILKRLEAWLEIPMTVLSAVWLCLMVIELGWSLSQFGQRITTLIWIIFILDFLLRFSVAPQKLQFMKSSWLTVISLLLPALRIFRVARAVRIVARFRGVQLVRILGSINRGMRALGKTMHRRGAGYVAALTVMVTFAGAAGMYSFERSLPDGGGFDDFWTALWWTAMIITTMGSEYWPKTPEGRALCLLLAVYAFSVFGYFTGTIATYFIGRDAEDEHTEVPGKAEFERLHREILALRKDLKLLEERPPG